MADEEVPEDTLQAFLSQHSLAKYIESFAAQGVSLSDLLFVENEQDLQELGVTLSVHRRKMVHLLKEYKENKPAEQQHHHQQHPPPPPKKEQQEPVEQLERQDDPTLLLVTPTKKQQHATPLPAPTAPTTPTLAADAQVPSEEDMLGINTAWNDFNTLDALEQQRNRDATLELSSPMNTHMDSGLRERYLSHPPTTELATTTTASSVSHRYPLPDSYETTSQYSNSSSSTTATSMKEQTSILDLEHQIKMYHTKYLNERAERCQTTIENERAMIDVQVRCEKEVTRMQQEIHKLEQTTTTFNNDSEVLRQEINHLSGRNARLQEELLESTHDKEMNDLKRQVQELNRVVQEQHEHKETLHTKLNAAEDMKVWLTKEWEKTEQEAVRLKKKLTRSSKEKVKADGSLKDMHELLVFLSEQLRVHEYDRGLRLAVKEEWSRLLMGSAVMNKWFVCEREVGMVKSWVLRR